MESENDPFAPPIANVEPSVSETMASRRRIWPAIISPIIAVVVGSSGWNSGYGSRCCRCWRNAGSRAIK